MNKYLLTGTLLCALGLAGCGGGGEPSVTAATTDSTTTSTSDPVPSVTPTDQALAVLGADLLPPALSAGTALEDSLVPDMAASAAAAAAFPAELKPPIS